jgi:hypothetical protein
MSKKTGAKTVNIFHRKDFTGEKNNTRITCKLCGTKHYLFKYHDCPFKPNILDLYCCAGGAGYGYYQAGFNVTGVDIVNRKNYFCDFRQSDAIAFLLDNAHLYHAVHASPPCQRYSRATALERSRGKEYPDLVAATRAALEQCGKPWIMENVVQAPMAEHLRLRGEMFGLKVIRERIFEFGGGLTFGAAPPPFTKISVLKGEAVIVFGKGGSFKRTGHGNGAERHLIIPDWRLPTVRQTWAHAMGMPYYMRDTEISESIPPAYTKFIGENIKHLL